MAMSDCMLLLAAIPEGRARWKRAKPTPGNMHPRIDDRKVQARHL